MPDFHSTPPVALAAWLDLATRDLVPSAQNRIRTEIETHFAESVQSYLILGLSEPNAHSAALTDLGDPSLAARRFAREYLTQQDIQKLGIFDRPPGIVALGPLSSLAILFFGMLATHSNNVSHFRGEGRVYYIGFIYIVIAVTLAVVVFRVVSAFWPSPVTTVRRALSLRFIFVVLFFILAAAAVWLMHPSPWLTSAVVTSLLAACFYTILSLYRLRKKLRHAADADFSSHHPGAA